MESYNRKAQRSYQSRETIIRDAHELIKDAVREKDSHFVQLTGEPLYKDVIENAMVSLASVSSFDAYYHVAKAYLRAQGPTNEDDWREISRLTGPGPAGLLGHMIRLEMSMYDESFEHKKIAISRALRDGTEDQLIRERCTIVTHSLPNEEILDLEKILKKS